MQETTVQEVETKPVCDLCFEMMRFDMDVSYELPQTYPGIARLFFETFKDLTVLVPQEAAERRDEIMRKLGELGIETRAYFSPPLHRQRYFQRFVTRPLPRTEDVAARVITLPFYTSITEEDIDRVVSALRQIAPNTL